MAPSPPRVFISYSHDSLEHARRVLGLAERLREDGIDAQLDQYVSGTPERGGRISDLLKISSSKGRRKFCFGS